jgi:hypothetical protein
MAKSPIKYRKISDPQKKDYFTEWKVLKKYLGGSVITYGDDAYIVTEDFTSTSDFNLDVTNGNLKRVSPPTISGSFTRGPYYSRSGGRAPTVNNGVKWIGSQYCLYRVRIIGAGGGDLNDGGYPWTAYNYYLYFRLINT